MKKFIATAIIFTILNIPGISLADGPFGLTMGMTYNQIKKIDKNIKKLDIRLFYSIKIVPRPHPAFESYIVQIGPTRGLSIIKAIGKNIYTSVYGTEIRNVFENMNKALCLKYGKGKVTDRLGYGSIWNEPKDFTMALIRKERALLSLWGTINDKTYSKSPPNNIAMIKLNTKISKRNTGYILLSYLFDNKYDVEAKLKTKNNQSL